MNDEGRVENAIEKPITPEQLGKYADLVAAGNAEFPDGLPQDQRRDLTTKVRSRLRRRMVLLIARAIAQDIRVEQEGRETVR